MTITLIDLQEKLKQLDEITLLELLDISSEEIVERFIDLIEDSFEKLQEAVED